MLLPSSARAAGAHGAHLFSSNLQVDEVQELETAEVKEKVEAKLERTASSVSDSVVDHIHREAVEKPAEALAYLQEASLKVQEVAKNLWGQVTAKLAQARGGASSEL